VKISALTYALPSCQRELKMRAAIFLLMVCWATLGLSAERVQQLLPNGDFEKGYSNSEWTVLGCGQIGLTDGISGEFSALFYELKKFISPNCKVFSISQTVRVPDGSPEIGFWSRASGDDPSTCQEDFDRVYIDNGSLYRVFSSDNCDSGGWGLTKVDLGFFAGETVTVIFAAEFTGPLTSRWEVDDVFFEFGAPPPLLKDGFENANQ